MQRTDHRCSVIRKLLTCEVCHELRFLPCLVFMLFSFIIITTWKKYSEVFRVNWRKKKIIDWLPTAQSKIKCRFFTDYWGIMQNIEEQRSGIFIADMYMKIFEDNVLNNFDEYFFNFFTDIFKHLQIEIRDNLWCWKLLQNDEYFVKSSNIQYRFLQNLCRITFAHKMRHSLR